MEEEGQIDLSSTIDDNGETSPDVELSDSSSCSSSEMLEIVEEHMCSQCEEIYENPRILQCLHVFCTKCLEKMKDSCNNGEGDAQLNKPVVINCQICHQNTLLSTNGVNGLPVDEVTQAAIKGNDKEPQLPCTSCKTQEKAVAQCIDCASFLCPGCVTAHQYMRCFDDHTVELFEDLSKKNGVPYKPVFCEEHTSQFVRLFCTNCRVIVCSECSNGQHQGHLCCKIEEVKDSVIKETKGLMEKGKAKLEFCSEATSSLEQGLSDLQKQREHATSLINETFQSYKAILEETKDDCLEQLEKLHNEQELNIMDMYNAVEKNTIKIEDGCKLVNRMIESNNTTHLLSMEKHITKQFMMLINNTQKVDVTVDLEFDSNINQFANAVKNTFGSFSKPLVSTVKSVDNQIDEEELTRLQSQQVSSSLDSQIPTDPFQSVTLATDVLANIQEPQVNDIANLPALNIPNLTSIASTLSVLSPQQNIGSIGATMPHLPLERSASRSSYSPAMSDSGISMDAVSTGSTHNGALMNYATLSKLGSVTFGPQGQVLINGQVCPGINMKSLSDLPPSLSTPSPRVQTPHGEPTLAALLSGMNLTGPTDTQSTLNDLFDLFSSTPTNTSTSAISTTATTPNDPIANYFANNQPSPTQGFQGQRNAFNTSPPATTAHHNIFGSASLSLGRKGNKMSSMQIRCKFGQLGPGKGQFNSPHGFCLGWDEDIIVADTNNHRIQIFEKTGEMKAQFGIPGREEGQLWYPRKVAVMRDSGKYVICDRGSERSRMQLFNKTGHFVKKIAIRYIDIVAGLAITQSGHIVAVDSVSPTVFVIAESGDLIKWFDCSDYMREPSDIAINNGDYYVCDFKGHCVVVFSEEGDYLRRIGNENITNFPNGIDISDAGDVLVGDSHGNRFHVAVFQRDGSMIGEFECPYVKVSRCCGLKITTEGYVVTLAKNNHHVLVLNTLYIT